MSDTSKNISKKVIFVYPSELIQSSVIETLAERNFEVYILSDHQKIRKIYEKHPSSFFFINIDFGMSIVDWEFYIMTLCHKCRGINLGIISFSRRRDSTIEESSLGYQSINCGFIEIKQNTAEAARQILRVLTANDVKGMGRIIHYSDTESGRNKVNFPIDGLYITGNILDLGLSGFTCTLDNPVPLIDRQQIRNLQIRLNGMILRGDCIFAARKLMDSEFLYVFAFDPESRRQNMPKIWKYIQASLQARFNREFGLNSLKRGASDAG